MKPSARLLQTLIGAHQRARIDPLSEAVTSWRVMPSDLDLFGHMNNSKYLAMMDLARIDFLVRVGLLPDVVRNRWIVPLGGASFDFKGSLKLLEPYEIVTRLVGWDERWFYFRQDFRRAKDASRPVGTGYVKALFQGPEGSVTPQRVIELAVGQHVPRPDMPDDVRERFGLPRRVSLSGAQAQGGREPIAIVGIGCRMPGGIQSPEDLWKVLIDGRECITDIPESRWDGGKFHDASGKSPGRTYVQRAGILTDDVREFDAAFFGITPREASVLDPQQRLLLEVSWEALEDAGVPPSSLAGTRTGVYVGGFMMDNQIIHSSPDNRERIESQSATASTLTMLSNRLSYFYDLRGPSVSMDTACSSSLVALHHACQSLWNGESEAALVGGVNAILLPETQITMAKGRFLSPRGRCHAFSDQADGYVRSEGAAVLLLKPLSAALRDGNPVYSVVLGTAINQDGRTQGITVPNGEAQVAVMREAYAKAGVDPRQVVYVEAHGTGTPVGDPIEARAIGTVVGAGRSQDGRCRMGSVKTNLGHLEAAAGVTGVIKAALTLKHGTVPPHLHLTRVNPDIPLEALGLHIPTRPEPLPRGDGPRVAGVNSFGYGGTNAHVVLAEPPARPAPQTEAPPAPQRPLLLPLSARAPEALGPLAARYADWLEAGRSEPQALCRAAALHRTHLRHRVALRATDKESLLNSLRALEEGLRDVPGLHVGGEPLEARKLLFVYTGMGPQWWAMGRQLMATEPVYRAAVEECDALFREISGGSIAEELAREEASSRVTRTEVAQPANAVVQIALTKLWASWGVVPDAVVGHSIGEVGSAWASGALSLREALTVAYHRSQLQARLAGRGGMLAVGLSPDEAHAWVERFGPGVAVAAINSASSVTLAGEKPALERIAAELAREGRFNRVLQVEVPYHSPLMDEIEQDLLRALSTLRPEAPRIPIYSTVTGRLMGGEERHDARYWWRNVRGTVLFADALRQAIGEGHGAFVEVGPHPVLSPSIRDGLREAKVRGESIASLVRKESEAVTMADALGRLYALGLTPDWRGYCGGGAYPGAPRYAWQKRLHWSESKRSLERRRAHEGHPLLVSSEPGPAPSWTAELNLAAHPFLADHRVAGSLLFPGAGHVELALAARQALTGDARCSVEELEFPSAVLLKEDASPRLTLVLSADTPAFRVLCQVDEKLPVLCARGKLLSAGRAGAPLDVAALEARLAREVDVAALYASLERRGLCYGPAFRAVVGLRQGPGEVLARLRLPEGVDAAGYHLHPVLLDAAFHSLIAAADEDSRHDVVPVGVERVHFLASPGREVLAHGRLALDGKGSLRGDLTLAREDGQVVAQVTGFTCRLLPRAAQDADAVLQGRLYARAWVPVESSKDETEAHNDSARWVVLGARGTPGAHEAWLAAPDVDALVVLLGRLPSEAPMHVVDVRHASQPEEAEDPVASGTEAADALLRTVKALAPGRVQRYYLVTSRAEAVPVGMEAPSLAHAPLLGLARTAMTERPDLRLTLVDLEGAPAHMGELLERLRRVGEEQEVAERQGRTYAARLVRTEVAPAQAPAPALEEARPGQGHELVIGEEGRLDTLGFSSCERRAPGAGEVEIEVESVPLGFKDVMKAMGMLSARVKHNTYFGDAVGMEGAGRISRVGPGVEGLAVGERVYGVAPAFLRSHVVLPAERVVKLPAHLSYEQGANLIVYLTVYHSLVKVARLRKGETVLVHGATGGVGLAAIEVARWCGAEVIATAGSEEKRQHLRDMGLRHVSHSRDVSFAEDVREWTGGRGVDVVLNFTPGETVTKSLACLAPFGRFIELGKMSFEHDAALHLRPFNENLVYAAVDFDRLLQQRPELVRRLYLEVMERFEAGDFQPQPSRSWPASQVEEAFRTLARGKHIGKVCVSLKDERLRLVPRARTGRLSGEATYLVTGGLGGFGLEVARWLAEQGARHLVLVSRRGAASEEAREALEALRARGVRVRAVAADVSVAADVRRLLAEVRADMPPLKGLVHSATVLEDKPLAELDRASLERVMAAKARGAWNLHQQTRGEALDFFVLFSSISSLIGNAGQGNYVAANAFLDSLALHRRRQGLAGTALQWGVLGETGLVARNAQVARHLELLGIGALSTRDALVGLGRVLDGAPEQVALVDVEWSRFGALVPAWAGARRLASLLEEGEAGRGQATNVIEVTFSRLDGESRQRLVETTLQRVVARVMRVSEGSVDVAVPLKDLGMDSIMALEIVSGLEAELGVKLSSMEVVSGPSLRELGGVLLGHVSRALPQAA